MFGRVFSGEPFFFIPAEFRKIQGVAEPKPSPKQHLQGMQLVIWCPRPESNRHSQLWPADFKSAASTNFATRARLRGALKNKKGKVAERQGFEPWEGINPQRFSRPPLSTAQPPLLNTEGKLGYRIKKDDASFFTSANSSKKTGGQSHPHLNSFQKQSTISSPK